MEENRETADEDKLRAAMGLPKKREAEKPDEEKLKANSMRAVMGLPPEE